MITPRPYQLDVVDATRSKVIAGARRVILQGATGSGKTTCASIIVKRAVEKGSRVLVLAHRRRLIEQMAGRLGEFGIGHGIIMAGERRSAAPVQIASRDTLASRAVRNEWIGFPPADLVIIDECHNSPEQYLGMLERYPRAVVVGLTATPTRGDGRGLGGLFDALVCTVPVSRLVADGHLVPVDCYAPQRPATGGKRALCGDAVYHWSKFAEGRPSVLFASKVDPSKAAAAAFNAAGVPAVHIDAHSTDAEREAAIDGLNSGKIKVVCNCALWGEGVDIPCLSCCVLLRLASSYVTFAQCVGRIMRPHPGKTRAVLIDHSGAVFEHGFPDEDVEWSLNETETVDERVQRDKKEGKRKEPICCPKCAFLYSGAAQCPACGYVLFKPTKEPSKKDALLFEVPREMQEAINREERVRYWQRCLATMAHKGRTCGAAAQMYKSRYGEFPGRDFHNAPEPSQWKRLVSEIFPQFTRARA